MLETLTKLRRKKHLIRSYIKLFSYHTDEQIKQKFAEIERKHVTIANFQANENEIFMAFPSFTVTADVRISFFFF